MIELRRPNLKDKELFFEWRNDPNIYSWCRQFLPLSKDEHEKYWYEQEYDKTSEMFAIYKHSDTPRIVDSDFSEGSVCIGCCGLTSIDYVNSRAEFSLYIGSECQGYGFGKQALYELFMVGFDKLGLNRIWGETFNNNPAIHVFESLGMELEGIRKQFYFRDGEFINAFLYSINKRMLLNAKMLGK